MTTAIVEGSIFAFFRSRGGPLDVIGVDRLEEVLDAPDGIPRP
jgi:hypothetical protein